MNITPKIGYVGRGMLGERTKTEGEGEVAKNKGVPFVFFIFFNQNQGTYGSETPNFSFFSNK